MCYKEELQKKNGDKLQRKFEEDNILAFIRDYFYDLNTLMDHDNKRRREGQRSIQERRLQKISLK